MKLVSFWDNVIKSTSSKLQIQKQKIEKIKNLLKFEIFSKTISFTKKDIFENHFEKLDKKIIKSEKTSTRENLQEKNTQTNLNFIEFSQNFPEKKISSKKKKIEKNLKNFLKNATKALIPELTSKNYQIKTFIKNFLTKIKILTKTPKILKITKMSKKVIIIIEIQNDKIFFSNFYIIIILSSSSKIQYFVSDYKISSFFINKEKDLFIVGYDIGLISFYDLNDNKVNNYKEFGNTKKINDFLKKNFFFLELKNFNFISNYFDEKNIFKILAIFSKNDQMVIFDENFCFKVFKILKNADFFEIKFLLNFENNPKKNFFLFDIFLQNDNFLISQNNTISFLDFQNSENLYTNLKFDKSIKFIYKTISNLLLIIFKTEEMLITDQKNNFNFLLPFFSKKKIFKIFPFKFSKYDQKNQIYNKFEILTHFIIITNDLEFFFFNFDQENEIFKIEKNFQISEKKIKKIFFLDFDEIDIKFHIYFQNEDESYEEIFFDVKKFKPKIKKLSELKNINNDMIDYFYMNSYCIN